MLKNMKQSTRKTINLKAMIAVRTLYACCVRAVNTLQQLLACRRSVMDAIKMMWKRRVDSVVTI